MNHGQAYLNGAWVDAAALSVPVDDLGFQLGVTVVERLRTFGGKPFRLAEHVRRLQRSLEIVGWDASRLAAEVGSAIDELMTRNAPLIESGDDWSISAFVTPGQSADAHRPTVCVYGYPLPFAQWAHRFAEGVALCVTAVRQTPETCWPAELKCRSRMHYYLADREAARRYPGSRAVLLDCRGYVAEASTANIVCYFADRGLVTPRTGSVLPGISQEFLFEAARVLGVDRREEDLRPDDLMAADEAFLTSTSVCMLPVVRVDEAPIGNGVPGTMYHALLAEWGARVGVDIAGQAVRFARRLGAATDLRNNS